MIRLDPGKALDRLSRGPFHLDQINHIRRANAEVQAQIVLRNIAPPATNFAKLHQFFVCDSDPGANREAVALGPDQLKKYAVISTPAVIQQK